MKKYTASIVIPTYNKSSRLALTMVSLANVIGIGAAQVIIVNDGSTDNTLEILKKYESCQNIKLISVANGGRAAARNVGISEAESDVVIFCDDDLLLSRDFINAHIEMHKKCTDIICHGSIYNLPYVKFFADPATGERIDGGGVKSAMLPYTITQDKIIHNFRGIMRQSKLSKFEKDIQQLLQWQEEPLRDEYGWIGCTGGNISIGKELLEAVGGFDSNLGKSWGCEDLELGYRLHRAGISTEWSRQAVNYHLCHHREGSTDIHNKALDYFYLKHNSYKIKTLKQYFSGQLSTLIHWAKSPGTEEGKNYESSREYHLSYESI